MVLGKLPVPGRPAILIAVGQGPTAPAVGAGRGLFGHFYSHLSFLSFSLSLGDARYRLKYCLKGSLNQKQPTKKSIVGVAGRCDGAGKTSSAGASYNFDNSRERAYCACSGWGWFGHFYSHLSFHLFLPLFGDGSILTEILSQRARGWSGGAMVLGKLPVPGRPTIGLQ